MIDARGQSGDEQVQAIQDEAEARGQYLVKRESGVYFICSERDGYLRLSQVAVGGATKRSCWQRERLIWTNGPSTTVGLWSQTVKVERWAWRPGRMAKTQDEALGLYLAGRASRLHSAQKDLDSAQKAYDAAQAGVAAYQARK